MTDDRDSYFFALKMMRLRALLTAERWAQPEDEFDLLAAASLARIIDRQHARTA
mgnify:CR=1 FL=1